MRLELALRLAILLRPESFELTQENVNPLLLYELREAERLASGDSEEVLWSDCFAECVTELQAKLDQLTASKSTTKPPGKPDSKVAAASKSGKVTQAQIKKIGYLLYQRGETPNYKEIGKLTMAQASARIVELEKVSKS